MARQQNSDRKSKSEDEDVSEGVKTILESEGIKMRLSAECIALEKRGDNVAVNVDCSSGDKTVIGSHTLLAVGRVPNTADLGLKNAGVTANQRGYIHARRASIGIADRTHVSSP